MQPTWWCKGVQCGLQFWDMWEIGCPNPWCTSKARNHPLNIYHLQFCCWQYTCCTCVHQVFVHNTNTSQHSCSMYIMPHSGKERGKKQKNWWVFLTILWVLVGEFWCSFQLCWWGHGRIASTWKLVPQLDALMLLHCCCCSTQRCRAAQARAHIIYLWWIDSPLLLAFSSPAHSQISQILYLRDMNCA